MTTPTLFGHPRPFTILMVIATIVTAALHAPDCDPQPQPATTEVKP